MTVLDVIPHCCSSKKHKITSYTLALSMYSYSALSMHSYVHLFSEKDQEGKSMQQLRERERERNTESRKCISPSALSFTTAVLMQHIIYVWRQSSSTAHKGRICMCVGEGEHRTLAFQHSMNAPRTSCDGSSGECDFHLITLSSDWSTQPW